MQRLSSSNNNFKTLKMIFSFIFVLVVAEIYFGSSYLIDFESIGGNSLHRYLQETKRGENANLLDSFVSELGDPIAFRLKIQNLKRHLKSTATATSDKKNTEQQIKRLKYLELRPHYNQLDLFIKQLSRAWRLERNPTVRETMDKLVNQFDGIDNNALKIRGNITAHRKSLTLETINTTIIFNTLNEITDVDALIENLSENIHAEWAQTAKLLVTLTSDNAKLFSSKLKKLKDRLPSFSWLVVPQPANDKLLTTLKYITLHTSTRYLLFTRRIRKMDPKLDLSSFLRPLLKRTADIIAGTVVLTNGQWESGCYQTKLIWSQLTVNSGYDNHRTKGLVQCDVTDSPFAISRNSALSILSILEDKKKNPKLGNFPTGYPIYLQFFHVARLSHDFVVKTHLATVFHIDDEIDKEKVKQKENSPPPKDNLLSRMTRAQWKAFISRNEISDIWTSSGGNTNGNGLHHFEFTKQEANIEKCGAKSNMLRPRVCMRNLHKLLIDSYRLFDKLGYQYSTEDGSALGATKLHDTLPWEADHDFAFRTQNITDLIRHRSDFLKFGYKLAAIINKPCMKGEKIKGWSCGYVGVNGFSWRLELWGQFILNGDYYQPDTVRPQFKNQFPLTRLLGEKSTRIRISDHWSQTFNNPGYYSRGRYGVDCLRHAQHWGVSGITSYGLYRTSTHFAACPNDGHHLCLNQYLADGNIQFQRPWA